MSTLTFRYEVPQHAIDMHAHLATYWNIHKTWNHIWFKDMCKMSVNTSTRKRKRFDSYTDDDDIFEHDCEYKNYFTFSVNFPDPPKPLYP